MVVLITGLPGTGKTYFAKILAKKTGARHLNSDRIRKELGKMGRYDRKTKRGVYEEMKDRMAKYLVKGEDVIVDATFFQKKLRGEFIRKARELTGEVYLVLMTARDVVIRERTGQARPDSEAGYDVYLKMKRSYEPLEPEHLTLPSDQFSLEEMLERTLKYCGKTYGTANR